MPAERNHQGGLGGIKEDCLKQKVKEKQQPYNAVVVFMF